MDFLEVLYSSTLPKICWANWSFNNLTKITGTSHEDLWTFIAQFFIEWEMFQTEAVGKLKTHFIFSNFFKKSCRLWDNVEKFGRAGQATRMTIWYMCIACWIHKSTNTHSEYVILTAFPLQKWLHKPTSMLSYTYISCLVCFCSYPRHFFTISSSSPFPLNILKVILSSYVCTKACCLLKLFIVLTGLPAAPNGVPGRTHVFAVLWTGLVCQAGWLYCHQVPGWAHGNAMGLWTSLSIPDCSAFCHDGSDWRGAYIFVPSKHITHRKWRNSITV